MTDAPPDTPPCPLQRDDVVAIVRSHQSQLQAMGVTSLTLFGSVARNEATSDSDVDFLVELARPAGFFELFRVQHYLEDLLHCRIDLGTPAALKEHLRSPVQQDAIDVF